MAFDLTVVWAGIIAFGIIAYVVMDGFDLGIGILFPTLRPGIERDTAMNTVAPVWDGNETWLVLGGGGLMAAFPLAYAVILPALYMPLTAMLLGLIFRGVAFEFRWHDSGHRAFWDGAFFGGSFIAALAQGIALGAILQGIEIEGRAYAGGWWDWLTPFSILTGVSLVTGYALLGAGWIIMKSEGAPRERGFERARILAPVLLISIVAVSLATPFLETQYFERWFSWPGIIAAAPIPLLVAVTAILLWRSIADKNDYLPFLLTLALFGLSLTGLAISMWPDVIPARLSIWDAAAPADSQGFMLIGTLVLVPIILAYTTWAYWVFRGKVGDEGYH